MTISNDLLGENIISVLGLEALPIEEKKAMIEKMTDLLMKRVMLRVVEEMTDEVLGQMPGEGSSPEALLTFVSDKVPNYDNIMNEELLQLKTQLANSVKDLSE